MRDDLVMFSITNVSRSTWHINDIVCQSAILKTELLNSSGRGIELLPSITNQFSWRLDEIIKSAIEFTWCLDLQSASARTRFEYMVDCNGNKPFFTMRNIVEPINASGMFPLRIQITNLSHDTDEIIEWQIG